MNAFLGELFGTLTLILLGNGVVACVLLKRSFGEDSGWMVVTTGWGFAVICGVLVALVIGSDAHINPAITIGVGIATGDWSQAPTYITAQMLGAMLGALLVWLHYLPHSAATEDSIRTENCAYLAADCRKRRFGLGSCRRACGRQQFLLHRNRFLALMFWQSLHLGQHLSTLPLFLKWHRIWSVIDVR